MRDDIAGLTALRARHPEAVADALARRRRRSSPIGESGTLFLIAADHPARGSLGVGGDPMAMADRGELLRRLMLALDRPGVDGILATADLVEDLALLGALDDKVVFASMNRGGLAGATFELDDRFTCCTPGSIVRGGLDGGKMMVRIEDGDAGTLRTLDACARAIDELAAARLPAMIEVFAVDRVEGRLVVSDRAERLIRALTIASGLGGTSAYTWLKVPVVADTARVVAATTLPTFLLGGDPGGDTGTTFRRWEEAMALPQVCGLVVGRTLLYPAHGDVGRAVDEAAAIVAGRAGT